MEQIAYLDAYIEGLEESKALKLIKDDAIVYNIKDYKGEICNDINCTKKEQFMKNDITLFEWLDEWYSTYKLPKLKPSSIKSMKSVIKVHIKSNFKNIPLKELRVYDIDKTLSKINSSKQRRTAYVILGDCLRKAYRLELIDKNIADMVEPVVHRPKEGKALSDNAIRLILNNCAREKVKNLFLFYLYTGCRKTEALSIKWNDIDFKTNVIHIPGTKRISSDRYMPLFDKVKALLEGQSKETELVFNVSDSTLKREIIDIKRRTGITFSVKDFRTTFATLAHKMKIDDLVIQQWMGHSDVQTTQKYYIKYDKGQNLKAIEQFNRIDFDPKQN